MWTARVNGASGSAHDPVDPDVLALLHETGGDLRAPWPAGVALLGVGVFIVAEVLALGARWLVVTAGGGPLAVLTAVASALYGVLLVAALLVHRSAGIRTFADAFGMRWQWSDLPLGLAASIAARIAAVLVTLPLVLVSPNLVGSNVPDRQDLGVGIGLLAGITVMAVVVAPLVEELFFRGMIQRSLETSVPPIAAIAVSSVLFGLAHLSFDLGVGSVGLILATGSGGAVFGALARFRHGIGTSIVAHAFFNAVPMAVLWAAR